MTIWTYAKWLTPVPEQHRITLGEAQTPVLRSRRIGPSVGLKNLFFKLETTNPSGSYKDRFAVTAIADMLAHGKKRCIATSSGNTGAALAALINSAKESIAARLISIGNADDLAASQWREIDMPVGPAAAGPCRCHH